MSYRDNATDLLLDADRLIGREDRLERDLHQAEWEAWKNLARYKFWMFGYFAGRWVYLNRLIGKKRPNPFKEIVTLARAKTTTSASDDAAATSGMATRNTLAEAGTNSVLREGVER